MAGKPSKPMTPFDKSVTPSYLYKWKLFLAFLPPSIQRFLAVYIKFAEFRYTMDHFRGLPFHAFSFQSISELAPYMDENERDMMNQMTSMMQMAEMCFQTLLQKKQAIVRQHESRGSVSGLEMGHCEETLESDIRFL